MSGRGCVSWGGGEKYGTEEWERLRGLGKDCTEEFFAETAGQRAPEVKKRE